MWTQTPGLHNLHSQETGQFIFVIVALKTPGAESPEMYFTGWTEVHKRQVNLHHYIYCSMKNMNIYTLHKCDSDGGPDVSGGTLIGHLKYRGL